MAKYTIKNTSFESDTFYTVKDLAISAQKIGDNPYLTAQTKVKTVELIARNIRRLLGE